MFKRKSTYFYGLVIATIGSSLIFSGCKIPAITTREENKTVPKNYTGDSTGAATDTITSAAVQWQNFFTDKNLANLIDTALKNNQELNITLQEIQIARNEIRMRKAALLPTGGIRAGTGVEKVGRYTSQGAGDATTDIEPGKEMPDPLGDFNVAAYAHWEVDIWKKLRNAKKAAVNRYLASIEGKNFVLTNLVAEVANSYYELLALDNQLAIIKQNITLQQNALEIVKIQKDAARATELGVQKFQAEVLKTESMEFDIRQQITETENRINFLLARYPQPISRDTSSFAGALPFQVKTGIPSQLLANRPDIRQAELDLVASKLDVKVARAEFYPNFDISAAVGLQAFKPSYLVKFPESLLYSLAVDMVAPLINRNALMAEFSSASARQIQSMYNYERTILSAYLEVATQLSNINNLEKNYDRKSRQVEALNRSIEVSNDLFKSARVDYFEVLMTQRDALEARLELVETKKQQFNAVVNVYRDLGGGWK
ncbi:TolC family protein [Flavihumibacter petaseus]|uniref:Putative RND-type efflux pump outer membrane protein n=1 Tax=Flavihumibacter petaseus NBRC 106054 TaxID=1220578 RepID=A0A0E9MWW3_9BACT|nr:TolC family protein [Flavihumibacter petaseus]GAO41901.1 putative RND-type efflux pump outer membrane protein [Flavihumibacter petaseus NBRC 106054]